MEAALRAIQAGATSLNLYGARACPVTAGGGRIRDAWAHGRGPPRRRAQCVGREGEREPLHGRAPRAALALASASGPARSRASFPCARASAWNRVALTLARGRGCAAPPQGTKSATTARQLWRPRSRRTRRSRRSTSGVRERARVAAGDGGVGGRLGPRPRPAAQARPMCGEGRERAFARPRASGCARPASIWAPRVLVRASLARVLRLGIVWR